LFAARPPPFASLLFSLVSSLVPDSQCVPHSFALTSPHLTSPPLSIPLSSNQPSPSALIKTAMTTFALTPCLSPLSKSSFQNSDLSLFPTSKTTSSSPQPQSNTTNRHSFPTYNTLWLQHQLQMQEHQREQHRQDEIYLEKSAPAITISAPSTPSFKPAPNRPRLSLDTSRELLGNITVIKHGDKSYLKLFSPVLVESPVSFLDQSQQVEDKKKWENGPDEAFQRQLEMERREAFKGKQRSFFSSFRDSRSWQPRFLFCSPPFHLFPVVFFNRNRLISICGSPMGHILGRSASKVKDPRSFIPKLLFHFKLF